MRWFSNVAAMTGFADKRQFVYALMLVFCSGYLLPLNAHSAEPPFTVKSAQVLLVDAETGTVLFSRNPDVPFPPASLAKLMTAEVAFNALITSALQPDTHFTVSEYAWRTGGAPSGTATMFAKINSQISVSDLVQGIVVQAANDGALILAEGLSGNVSTFVEVMNRRAKDLGLTGSVFANPTGLPEDGISQKVTLTDMLKLAQHLQKTYPQYYPLYAQESFTWNNIMQRNRNPLLRLNLGADGLAMGGTPNSGLSIIASAEQNGRRIFLGLNGAQTVLERAEEAEKLIRWAMDDFIKLPVFAGNTEVAQASLYGGTKSLVNLIVQDEVSILVPRADKDKVHTQVVYHAPVSAPVRQGQQIGRLQVLHDKEILLEQPVYAGQDVAEGSLKNRSLDALYELTTGWIWRLW